MRAAALALVWIVCAPGLARATNDLPVFVGLRGSLYSVPVKSVVDLRFENVVRQTYETSCGAAALATVLRYYYGEDVSEHDVIAGAMELMGSKKEELLREGLSMRELKRYSESLGYESDGYRISDVERLYHLKVPAIAQVVLNTPLGSFPHFVVIRKVENGEVHVADPAYGNRKRPLDGFANEWKNRILLFVLSGVNPGDGAFLEQEAVLKGRVVHFRTLTDFGVRPITPGPGSF